MPSRWPWKPNQYALASNENDLEKWISSGTRSCASRSPTIFRTYPVEQKVHSGVFGKTSVMPMIDAVKVGRMNGLLA